METQFDIRSQRKALKLTQQELADELGVNISTIWRYEDGRLAVPKPVRLAISALTAPTPQESSSQASEAADG